MAASTFQLLRVQQTALRTLRGVTPAEPPPSTVWYGFVPFGLDNAASADRHYTIDHAAALDMVAATGWAWGVYVRLGQNAGTVAQYILSSGLFNANPSLNWFITEISNSGVANSFFANVSDATTDNTIGSATPPVELNQIFLIVLQYNPSSGNGELYVCKPGESAQLVGTATGPDGNITAPGDWHFGSRSDADTDRYFQSEMGGLFKVDRRITPTEIELLAPGLVSPVDAFFGELGGAWAFLDGAVAVEPDLSPNGNDATRQGTGWSVEAGTATLIARWHLNETSGSTAADDIGVPANGTIAGATYEDGGLVDDVGDAERCLGFVGGSAVGITITGAGQNHPNKFALAEPNIVGYAQLTRIPAVGEKLTLFARDRGSGNNGGGCAVQIVNDGGVARFFVYRRTEAGSVVQIGDVAGFGTVPSPGTAFKWALLTNLTDGTSFVLNTTAIASNPTMTAGWTNNQFEAAIAAFRTGSGLVGALAGYCDLVEVWSGRMTVADVAALAPAQNYVPDDGGELGDIETTRIVVHLERAGNLTWTGLGLSTDTANGGSIASSSGGTLPAFPIYLDPTDFVDEASGGKSTWTVQFRNSTLGTWAKLSSGENGYVAGDWRFTPSNIDMSTDASRLDTSEYRVSDDGGTTWSPWTEIVTRVFNRALLAPPPYYLVEDMAGSNDNTRLNNARAAAQAAGGGTVTTLDRDDTLQDILNHNMGTRVNYLYVSCDMPADRHLASGDPCGVNVSDARCPNSQWLLDTNSHVFQAQGSVGAAIAASGVRVNILGGRWNGKHVQRALHFTSGNSGSTDPASPCGTCWPGPGNGGGNLFNLQFSAGFQAAGDNSNTVAGRAKFGIYGVDWKNFPGDGIRGVGSIDMIAQHNRVSAAFRGGFTMDGGNSKRRSLENFFLEGENHTGTGIDDEMLTHPPGSGNQEGDFEDIGNFITEDIDQILRDSCLFVHRDFEYGPGFNIFTRTANAGAARPRAEFYNGIFYYHGTNGTAGGEFRFGGWSGGAPHDGILIFEDCEWVTWGAQYVKHYAIRTPLNTHTWGWDWLTMAAGAQVLVEMRNCRVRIGNNMPAGGNPPIKLWRTVNALNTSKILRLDGMIFGAGVDQAACTLNGQRLEYRNVVHQGFPSATIQQMCPGAGAYVAI